ncbi:uncharacterized protein LOC119732154 [Patiria miniata]|uniref:Uncharacterized protein n=1 Tax=Patiria miniata TaxID=46514 RepID=A0A914AC45_PATMI|nr:uncharacterized protein LOC119732154 [Patiria miniata]
MQHMASNRDDKGELSFSEWCDRKFTNMYSHDEFASPCHKSIGQTPIKARLQMTPAKQDGRNADTGTLGHKGHRRVTQPPFFSCSDGKKTRPRDEAHLRATQSTNPERWPRISPKVSQKDVKPPSARCCDKMKSLSVSDEAGGSALVHDDTQPETNKISPRNPVKKIEKIKCTVSEDVLDEMGANEKKARRVSVDSGSSGQESHASKRTFSELSPGRKHTRSRKGKKRLRGSGICPKKTEEVQQQAVCSPDVTSHDWDNSKMSSGSDVTRVMTVEDISNKKASIQTQETLCTATKERSRTKPGKNKTVESVSMQPTGKDSSGKVKFQIKSKTVFSKSMYVDSSRKCGDVSTSTGQKLHVVVAGSKISRKDSTVAKVEETQWKGDSILTSTCMHSSSSRSRVEAVTGKKQNANEEGQRSEYAKEKPTEDNTVAKVKYRKDSKKSRSGKCPEEVRVPSGEYDVESSVDSEGTKYETQFAKAWEAAFDDGPQISSRGEKVAKEDCTSKSGPAQPSCEKLSKSSSSTGKSVDKAKVHIAEQRSKSEECVSNTKEIHVKCKMEKHKLSPPTATSRHGGLVAEKSSVNSIPRAKGAGTKEVQDGKKVTKDKRADCRSPSPKDKSSVGASFFTKCVLDSVLKPLSLPRSAAKVRPKSAESAKTTRRTDRTGHVQRKPSRPTSKVRLEHIYQAFDNAVSIGSEEEVEAEPLIGKKLETKPGSQLSKESQPETFGIPDHRQSQKFHHISQHQTENQIKPQPESLNRYSNKEAEDETMECCTNSQPLTGFKVDSRSANLEESVQAASCTSQFIPRSVSRNREKVSLAEGKSKVSSTPAIDEKSSEEVAGVCVDEKTMAKTDYIVDWLDKQDQPRTESSKVTGRQDLEPGEVPDDSSSSDEAWEQLVDSIMKGNNEEIFSSPYCKRVSQQKRHASGIRSVAPFRSSSFPVELEFKPRISTSQKNVATVSPYYVHPPAPQPMKSSACTWSGPMPDFLDENNSLNPSARPFHPFNSTQKPSDVTHSMNTMGSFSALQGKRENTKTTPARVLERAPGDYPGNRDSSPTIMHGDALPASSNAQKIQPVFNVPPRFLRLAQLQSCKGQPVNVHVSSRLPSSPECVYSKGICRENLVSTSRTPSLIPQSSTSSLSVMTSKASSRSWTLGSLGWSSSLTRTPGTITPTRFTPWTNEVSTPSPWKTCHAPKDTSVELCPIVDYPVCSVPYIDTHCHIDFLFQRSEFHGTFEKFSRIHNFPPNYAGCLAVFCTPEGFEQGALWKDLVMEKNIWMAFGCHPHHAKSYDGIVEENIIRRMRHPKAIALGEIGLDYSNRCTSDRPLQIEVFRRQLRIALQMGKPLVIHSRDAEHDTLSIMKEIVPRNYKIHRHCFTGSPQEARNFFQAFPNSFIGLTALVTFPSAFPVHRTATEIPLGKILLETDAPYFLPKQCPRVMRWANPSMAVFVAVRIAQLRGIPLDEVLYAVRRNTTEMYGI